MRRPSLLDPVIRRWRSRYLTCVSYLDGELPPAIRCRPRHCLCASLRKWRHLHNFITWDSKKTNIRNPWASWDSLRSTVATTWWEKKSTSVSRGKQRRGERWNQTGLAAARDFKAWWCERGHIIPQSPWKGKIDLRPHRLEAQQEQDSMQHTRGEEYPRD